MLVRESGSVPACILRPSIVGPALRHPHVGWVDTLIGPGGLVLAAALGILRVMQGDSNAIVDLVPVDHVCNAIIAAAWSVGVGASAAAEGGTDIASTLSSPSAYSSSLPIYVVGTSQHNPLQWKWLIEVMQPCVLTTFIVLHGDMSLVRSCRRIFIVTPLLIQNPSFGSDGLKSSGQHHNILIVAIIIIIRMM